MNKHKGFTVVELLIVIVVIGILAAIVIVSYSFLRDDGMDAKIKSTVKTVGDAMQLYEAQQGTRVAAQGQLNLANGVDTKLTPKYLKPGYRDGLKSKKASSPEQIIVWYSCDDGGGGIAVYAMLNNPTDEDKTHAAKVRAACKNESRVNATYTYAQVF